MALAIKRLIFSSIFCFTSESLLPEYESAAVLVSSRFKSYTSSPNVPFISASNKLSVLSTSPKKISGMFSPPLLNSSRKVSDSILVTAEVSET